MRFDIEHGIEALYQVAAEGVYQEHKFSTIRRDFVIDTQLIKSLREFCLHTTWCKQPELTRSV